MAKEIIVTREQIMRAFNFYIQFFGEDWGLKSNTPYNSKFEVDNDVRLILTEATRSRKSGKVRANAKVNPRASPKESAERMQ